jgi:UDP-N-acetylglucosamine--N-acetylmuramyl-(pentapeptide) pyrophosphoryl-undecaprenol N-acetylglucosamine transferase
MRLLIAGGGTGGHVFPALAIAEQLVAEQPDAALLFVGSAGGLEERLVPARGFALCTLPVGKLKGQGLGAKLRTLVGLGPALGRALRLVRRFRPHVIVGVGGYASAPVVAAGALLRRPVVLLEQNAIPGATNRRLARLADRVVLSFAGSERYFPGARTTLVGNPVRPELAAAFAAQPGRIAAGPGLLVLGGSQGAHRLNELVAEIAPALVAAVPGLRLRHQTGDSDLAQVSTRYAGLPGAHAAAFIDDVAAAYADADLVLSRAGATTLAELALAGKPALLVPYPFAADDHQAANAASFVAASAARVLRQDDLDGPRLLAALVDLLRDDNARARMSAAMIAQARPDAARTVVALLRELARPK